MASIPALDATAPSEAPLPPSEQENKDAQESIAPSTDASPEVSPSRKSITLDMIVPLALTIPLPESMEDIQTHYLSQEAISISENKRLDKSDSKAELSIQEPSLSLGPSNENLRASELEKQKLDEAQNEEQIRLQEEQARLEAQRLENEAITARQEQIASISTLLSEQEALKASNITLQVTLADFLKRKRVETTAEPDKSNSEQATRYKMLFDQYRQQMSVADTEELAVTESANALKKQLEISKAENLSKRTQYTKEQRTIAAKAENSKTGQELGGKAFDQLVIQARKKTEEVSSISLDYIKLRNRLHRHEMLLRQKEELAEGLHLIDFEQLKIENQTYNEKVQSRNEEITKLRKKISTIVQTTTHVKEKLHFIIKEKTYREGYLEDIEQRVGMARDHLPFIKQERDLFKNASATIKQKNGLLGNLGLLQDYEKKVDASDALQKELEQMQAKYKRLNIMCSELRRKSNAVS